MLTVGLGPAPQPHVADLLLPEGAPAGIQRRLIPPCDAHAGCRREIPQLQAVEDLGEGVEGERVPALRAPLLHQLSKVGAQGTPRCSAAAGGSRSGRGRAPSAGGRVLGRGTWAPAMPPLLAASGHALL